MSLFCLDLKTTVIEPALKQAQLTDTGLPAWLEAVACAEQARKGTNRHGPFGMTAWQHQRVWDQYIALSPELACCIRGLASQRAFLADPHRELELNWGYATALAALNARFQLGGPLPRLNQDQAVELWRLACHRGRPVDEDIFRACYPASSADLAA